MVVAGAIANQTFVAAARNQGVVAIADDRLAGMAVENLLLTARAGIAALVVAAIVIGLAIGPAIIVPAIAPIVRVFSARRWMIVLGSHVIDTPDQYSRETDPICSVAVYFTPIDLKINSLADLIKMVANN
jgi:hypothetical protein